MKKWQLIVCAVFFSIGYVLVLLVATVLELVKRIVNVVCEYFDEVLDGIEAPYLNFRNQLSEKKPE